MNKNNIKIDVKKLCGMAIFVAFAIVATFLTKWLRIAHLTFDAKDAIITIAAYVYGPFSAVLMSFVTSLIESIIVPDETSWYGLIMNIASTLVFSVTASYIYKNKRNINGAIIGLLAATGATTAVMLLLNMFVTPFYMQSMGVPMTIGDVIGMIPILLLPFNMAKAIMNSAITLYLYKPVTLALRSAKLIEGESKGRLELNRNSVIMMIVGFAGLIISAITFIVLHFLNN
jgi:riboflavin transporter FmnP